MSTTDREGHQASGYDRPAHHSRLRLLVMAVVGIGAAVAVGLLKSWSYAPAMGWGAACATYLVWVWSIIGGLHAGATAAHARRDDPGRAAADALVLAATIASFGGVALILLEAAGTEGVEKSAIIALALGSVALSWFLVHTLFALRYASIYYRDKSGVDFNEDSQPRYLDFAYLSFTVGMCFQVSDTNLKTDAIRGTVLRHALLSYLLGAIVLATTINLVSGMVR